MIVHRYWKRDDGAPFDEAITWVECANGQTLAEAPGSWCVSGAQASAVADFAAAIAPGGDYYNAALASNVDGFYADEADYLAAVATWDAAVEATIDATRAASVAEGVALYAARVDAAGALVTVGLTSAQAALIAGVDPADMP